MAQPLVTVPSSGCRELNTGITKSSTLVATIVSHSILIDARQNYKCVCMQLYSTHAIAKCSMLTGGILHLGTQDNLKINYRSFYKLRPAVCQTTLIKLFNIEANQLLLIKLNLCLDLCIDMVLQ